MTECEVLLAEAIAKKDAAVDREARHAVACAVLSETVVYLIENLTPSLNPNLTSNQSKQLINSTVRMLMRAHEQSMLAQDGINLKPSRLMNSDMPFVWTVIKENHYEDRGTSQERSGRM